MLQATATQYKRGFEGKPVSAWVKKGSLSYKAYKEGVFDRKKGLSRYIKKKYNMDAREKLDEYAKTHGWNTNKLIGWSQVADFAEWLCLSRNQESDIKKQDEELIIAAVNQYWHQANNNLGKKDLGHIERITWEGIRTKCGKLLRRLGSF